MNNRLSKKEFGTRLGILILASFLLYGPRLLAAFSLNVGQLYLVDFKTENKSDTQVAAQEWLERSLAYSKSFESIQLKGLIGLGSLALERNQAKEAQNLLESQPAIKQNPIGALLLGHAYLANEQENKAISIWKEAEVGNKYFIRYGLVTKDLKWYRIANQVDPSSHGFFLLAYQGEWGNAMASYEKAVELDSNWISNEEKFLAAYYLGLALDSQGGDRRMEAKSAYLQALSVSDRYGVYSKTYHPTIYQRLANLAQAKGDYQEEIDWLTILANTSPNSVYYTQLSKAVFAQAGLTAAEPYFDKALNAQDVNPDIVRQIGQFLIAHGELDAAHQYCDHLVPPQVRDSWQVVACQAEIWLAEGKVLNAYRVLERGLSKNLSSDYTSQLLAKVCQQLSDMPPVLCQNMEEN